MHVTVLVSDRYVCIHNNDEATAFLEVFERANPRLARTVRMRHHDFQLVYHWDGELGSLKKLCGRFIIFLTDGHLTSLCARTSSTEEKPNLSIFAQQCGLLGHLLVTSEDIFISHFGDSRTDDFERYVMEYLEESEPWAEGH